MPWMPLSTHTHRNLRAAFQKKQGGWLYATARSCRTSPASAGRSALPSPMALACTLYPPQRVLPSRSRASGRRGVSAPLVPLVTRTTYHRPPRPCQGPSCPLSLVPCHLSLVTCHSLATCQLSVGRWALGSGSHWPAGSCVPRPAASAGARAWWSRVCLLLLLLRTPRKPAPGRNTTHTHKPGSTWAVSCEL
jgi:hypothetical protein